MTALSFVAELLKSLARQGAQATLQQGLLLEVLEQDQRDDIYRNLLLEEPAKAPTGFELMDILTGKVRSSPLDALVAGVLAAEGRADLLVSQGYLTTDNAHDILYAAAYRGRVKVLELAMEEFRYYHRELYEASMLAVKAGQAEVLDILCDEFRRQPPMFDIGGLMRSIPAGRAELLFPVSNFYSTDTYLIRDLQDLILERENPESELLEAAAKVLGTINVSDVRRQYGIAWDFYVHRALTALDEFLAGQHLSALEVAVLVTKFIDLTRTPSADTLRYALQKGVNPSLILTKARALSYPEVEQAALELGAE